MASELHASISPSLALQHTEKSYSTTQKVAGQVQDLDGSIANRHNCETNAASVFSMDDSSASWPSIYPNALQTQLYGALYSIDPSDDFYLGHQPYLFSTGGLTNDISANDIGDWPQLWDS